MLMIRIRLQVVKYGKVGLASSRTSGCFGGPVGQKQVSDGFVVQTDPHNCSEIVFKDIHETEGADGGDSSRLRNRRQTPVSLGRTLA